MTSNRSHRVVVVALVTILTCSVVLGAAVPAAATGSSPSGDGSVVQHSLDLGSTVGDTADTVTGDADETNASSEGGESKLNATRTAESDNESITGVVDQTTGGLEEAVHEIVSTRTPTQTDDPVETSTVTPTPTPEPTPEAESDGGEVDQPVGETVATTAGESTLEESQTEADGVDEGANLAGTTADVVDGVGTGPTETVDGAVNKTTTTVQETTDATGRTIENTTNDTGSAVDETVRTAAGKNSETTETGDGVTDLTNETVGSTTRNADGTVRTAGTTTDEVANATAAGTADSTSAVTTTVDETVSSTTGLFDDGNGTVTRLAGNVTSSVDTATGGLTAVVDDTARTVQRTTDTVTDGLEGTVENTGQLVDETVDNGVTGGMFGPDDGDFENTEAYGWPTEESGLSSADGIAASGATGQAGVAAYDSAAPARLASMQASSSESSGDEPKTDDTASSADEGLLPSLDEVDPATGGAIAGALLVSGSFLATRAGMTVSSMGAGAATLPQLLFSMLREFGLRLAVLAGYSRYDFSDPLENENRASVLETVEASPGINLTSLVEETGLTESTVRYHVRVLEHEGLLDGAKVRGRRRFVPRTNEDVELLAAFEEEATRDVIDALFEHEPASGTTLAEALDRDPSTVSHHLSRLSDAGLVEREQDGPALRNSLSADVRAALSDVEVTASVQQHVQADD